MINILNLGLKESLGITFEDDILREKCPNTVFFMVRVQSKYRKIRTRKTSVFGHFPRSAMCRIAFKALV